MPVAWSSTQTEQVGRILCDHPANSARCAEAADNLFPIAREHDDGARIWQLWPAEGRWILPKLPIGEPWFYHVTVEVEAHCVDALTGVGGTLRVSYPEEHWKESDALLWIPDDGRRPII